MKAFWPPQDQVFWYLKRGSIKPCRHDIETDIAIIGGGMAGLSAAQAFAKKGKKVVLLEQYYCGSGASGKSSGFITPNAELSLTDFAKRYNMDVAHQIWKFFISGVEDIRSNIIEHQFACDYAQQDVLIVANSTKALKELLIDQENIAQLGYKSSSYAVDTIKQLLNAKGYVGGVGYEDTFGISAYLYCQEMKQV